MRRPLFAYGTLIDPTLMSQLLGRLPDGQQVWLDGYRRWPVKGQCYPALIHGGSRKVAGWLYQGLDWREWAKLDRYEGPEYRRRLVRVVDGDGLEQRAWAYVWQLPIGGRLLPRPWLAPNAVQLRLAQSTKQSRNRRQ